jgi:hypothetical protein
MIIFRQNVNQLINFGHSALLSNSHPERSHTLRYSADLVLESLKEFYIKISANLAKVHYYQNLQYIMDLSGKDSLSSNKGNWVK